MKLIEKQMTTSHVLLKVLMLALQTLLTTNITLLRVHVAKKKKEEKRERNHIFPQWG